MDVIEDTPYEEVIDETCPNCRMTVPIGTVTCPYCGYQIREGAGKSREVQVEGGEGPKKENKLMAGAGATIAMGALALGSLWVFPPAALLIVVLWIIMIALIAS